MKTKFLCLFATLLCSASLLFAQERKIENTEQFLSQLEKAASSVKSIESDFKQIKHLDIFDEEITSLGKFYYRFENKISLNYQKPMSYLIVINNDKIMINSDGRKNIMSLKDNKLMSEMQGMLTASMTGNFSNVSKDYRMEYFDAVEHYLVKVTPINATIKTYISEFKIYLDKKDFSVVRLRIIETQSDYTDYFFSNKKFNTLANDDFFVIK